MNFNDMCALRYNVKLGTWKLSDGEEVMSARWQNRKSQTSDSLCPRETSTHQLYMDQFPL